ncbi:hypothetical protein [Fulvimarina sp. MAC3]|uniref:hypothetical protein n=1 Tax=Fulvimarina sp. MAC3 TaxID=3148887 RepID=UPI0031FD2D64
MMADHSAGAAYAPRPVTHCENRKICGFRLKIYTIIGPGRSIEASIIEAALEAVARRLSAVPQSVDESGLGFVILHLGTDANWLLIDRWVFGDSLKQANLRSPLADPHAFAPVDDPDLLACVWEAGIIEFERRAFIETMMTTKPDESRYLSGLLKGEV